MSFDRFLETKSDEHRAIFRQLHSLILDLHPAMAQTIKWGLPVFTLKKNIAYFDVQKGRPLIGIMYAYQIPEVQPVLVAGNRTRIGHYYLEEMNDEKWSEVLAILQLAIGHDLRQ